MIADLINDALCYDDVSLIPQFSSVFSRKEVNLNSYLGHTELTSPVISANMDTVTELSMWLAMREAGGFGYIHRFMEPEKLIKIAGSSNPTSSLSKGGTSKRNAAG